MTDLPADIDGTAVLVALVKEEPSLKAKLVAKFEEAIEEMSVESLALYLDDSVGEYLQDMQWFEVGDEVVNAISAKISDAVAENIGKMALNITFSTKKQGPGLHVSDLVDDAPAELVPVAMPPEERPF